MNAPTSVGRPLRRVDGPAKVTGSARYASDIPPPGVAHAALALSPIAQGRIGRGGEVVGWDRRRPEPGTSRDGEWRVGLGCAATVRPVKTAPACLRVSVEADGSATCRGEIPGRDRAYRLTPLLSSRP